MATEAQIKANRKNAKKSTGPQSPEGKQTVSRNAIRHGLLTASTLAAGEDPAEFEEFARRLRNHYSPQTAMEEIQAARITDCLWKLQRLNKVEAGCFTPVDEPEYDDDDIDRRDNIDPQYVSPAARSASEAVNPGAIERQFAFSARSSRFDLIQRYEAHLEKKLAKASEDLERLQFARTYNLDLYLVRKIRTSAPLSALTSRAWSAAEHYRIFGAEMRAADEARQAASNSSTDESPTTGVESNSNSQTEASEYPKAA